MTNDIRTRIHEHKHRLVPGLTDRYGIDRFMDMEEVGESPLAAITGETQLKGWRSSRKVALIEEAHPKWNDLSADW